MSKYQFQKKLRYVYVSLFTAPIGQALLFLFYEVGNINPLLSNFLAVTISTTPNYLLNRFWVWRRRSTASIQNEILPYWMLAFLGLGLSTIFVYLADSIWETWLAINLANAIGYTLLWGVKYFILEKYLFKETTSSLPQTTNSL
jgi:putative flippase GtrA